MLVEDPRYSVEERPMGKPINLAVLLIVCYNKSIKATGLAVSAPVAHGGDRQYRAGLSVE